MSNYLLFTLSDNTPHSFLSCCGFQEAELCGLISRLPRFCFPLCLAREEDPEEIGSGRKAGQGVYFPRPPPVGLQQPE